MNLHEYQAKQLFAEYGLPVSKGIAVDSGAEAVEADGRCVAHIHALIRQVAGHVQRRAAEENS